jgi:hypothetical protein
VRDRLKAGALLALYRLTRELKPEHAGNREPLQGVNFVSPRQFSDEMDPVLLGYPERLHSTDRRIREGPWARRGLPTAAGQLHVRGRIPLPRRATAG